MADRLVPVAVDDGDLADLVVVAQQVGPVLVADDQILGRLERVSASVEKVSRQMLDAAKRASPTTAKVELAFSLAVEQGQLMALLGKGKGEASITVTLEWTKPDG
jgi:hypothetical protein